MYGVANILENLMFYVLTLGFNFFVIGLIWQGVIRGLCFASLIPIKSCFYPESP